MRFLYTTAGTVVFFLYTTLSHSQEEFSWSIRQHSRDKNLTSKPALIQRTSPDEGDSSTSLDLAIKGSYLPQGSDREFSLTLERHKNTLITKEQDLSALVFAVEDSWGDLTDGYSFIPEFSFAHKTDKKKDSKSLLAIGELTGIWGKAGINYLKGSDDFKWYWAPTVGLEYENIIDAEDNNEGNVSRFYTDIDITFYPFFKKLDNGRLSLFYSYSYWNDFSEDDDIDDGDDTHKLKAYGISWQLTESPPKNQQGIVVSLEIKWVDGEDPRNNKSSQEYNQIGIGILY
ncbi:hypothetical protein [Candidatus Thiodiazotropha sp. CDECU1]|uniref:hypothetical protein n=1 Tax=Candidatus Thiodiazotropha sp. CDECU1 TaxID=3065865 RepID=UPI00292CA8C7|nr:hypothetical protein [Candidatus Thiodiazotropha sp. CDECU1]